MASICKAMKDDMGMMATLQEVMDKKLTGFITMGSATFYVKDGVPTEPPKSEYQLILEELDKEFPGVPVDTAQ